MKRDSFCDGPSRSLTNAEISKPPTQHAKHSTTPEETYLKHIHRLQDQNRLLAECLADERQMRKEAYKWYQDRLNSRFWGLFDMMMRSMKR